MKKVLIFIMVIILALGCMPFSILSISGDAEFLLDDWSTSDGVYLSFYDDETFTLDWTSFYLSEEGRWSVGKMSNDSFSIQMQGSSILTLMSLIYGITSNDYHFEILKCNNDNFYLVQVYGDYTAKTSPCKLGFTRNGANRDFGYKPDEKPEKKIISDKQFAYYGYSVKYSDSYFSKDSKIANNDLAMLCGVLSWSVYHDSDKPSLEDIYENLGIPEEDIFDNAVQRNKDLRFSIAKKTLNINNTESNLLIICARGTINEALRDHYTKAQSDFFGYTAYDLVYEFEENNDDGSIMSELNNFLTNHPDLEQKPLKVLITGHSLGGAAANLVAARFNMFADGGAWWSNVTSKKDIFCYTFGAIDSIKTEGTISSGHENIHNITNFHDSFGPDGWKAFTAAGNTRYGKFGHIDLFDTDKDNGAAFSMGNHMMNIYLDAIRDNIIEYENVSNQKIVSFHCPVDIKVFEGDTLVAKVVNNQVDYSVTKIPVCVIESSKHILLNNNQDYRFEIAATDEGIMNYFIRDADTGKCLKGFNNVKLLKGKIMSSSIISGNDFSSVKLYVVDDNSNIVFEINEDGSEKAMNNTVNGTKYVIFAGIIIIALGVLALLIIKRKKEHLDK